MDAARTSRRDHQGVNTLNICPVTKDHCVNACQHAAVNGLAGCKLEPVSAVPDYEADAVIFLAGSAISYPESPVDAIIEGLEP